MGEVSAALPASRRLRLPAAASIWAAVGLLFVVSWIVQPQSLSFGALSGMLPFAAILALVAAGQTLVIQQGGIDLSVPGMVSLGVVLMTRVPNGDQTKLPIALALAFVVLVGAGLANGVIVNKVGITPIVTTLGMNALLFGGVIFVSGGTPRDTTALWQSLTTDTFIGVSRVVWIAVAVLAVVAVITKYTAAGRRFEAVETLRRETKAWSKDVNATQRGVDWQMKVDDARMKLKSVYPTIKL